MNRRMKNRTLVAFTIALFCAIWGFAWPASQTLMIPMRDGTKLATDVYLPEGKGPWPALLSRTPYNKNGFAGFSAGLMGKGYVLVAQDLRGRFKSEGQDSLVFTNDGIGQHNDGYDTVEWIAGQNWSNGKIATFGSSAGGIVQNMMAPTRPPHLVAQWVHVACSSLYHQAMYQGGAFRKSMLEGWLKGNQFSPENLRLIRAHPEFDSFWKNVDTELAASKVNVPAMFVGGWYDIFCQGTINSFVLAHTTGDKGAKGRCRLVMGPWAHGNITDLEYPNAGMPPDADALKWSELWLKNDGGGLAKIPVVQYYVMGDPTDPDAPGNEWRTADAWPIPASPTPFYFHRDGSLSGTLPADEKASRSYEYDPKNPVPTVGGANLLIPLGPKDQRAVEACPDVLVFTTEALDKPIEVTGRVKVVLWVTSSALDTDFTAKLTDVYPDGRSMLLLDGILRARYRNGFEKSELMKPGTIYKLEIDLWSTSIVFNSGHRIRVAISSSNSPRFEPNPNTGEHPVPDAKTLVAENSVFLDRARPSHVVLPVASQGNR